jgi:hypothetical protein
MSGGTTRVMPFRPFRQPMLVLLLAAIIAAAAPVTAREDTPPTPPQTRGAQPALFRIFLKDGTALASFGEFAEVGGRVYFSLPLGTGRHELTSVATTEVDWPRTDSYRDSVRAAHYAATRGEAEYAEVSARVAGLLTEIAKTGEANEQLRLATEARRQLIEWPRDHFAYKADEVRQTLGVLDEVIAGLRARVGGSGTFDLSLVAGAATPPPVPLLDPPSLQESIEQALRLANLAGSPAERVSMLRSVQAVLDDVESAAARASGANAAAGAAQAQAGDKVNGADGAAAVSDASASGASASANASAAAADARAAAALPADWKKRTRAQVHDAIADEMRTDGDYASLVTSALASAARQVARADVRGLTELREQARQRDERLGRKRPEQMQALLATLDQRLDAARRVRLARDQWVVKSEQFRVYQKAMKPSMKLLTNTVAVLNDIRALAGPSMQTLTRVEGRLESQRAALKAVAAPGDLQGPHASLVSAWQMAEAAVQQRKRAIASNNMSLAWNASAAASGALMLFDHARAELTRLMTPPATP